MWSPCRTVCRPSRWTWPLLSLQILSIWWTSSHMLASRSSRERTTAWWWSLPLGQVQLTSQVRQTDPKNSRGWWGAWVTLVPVQTRTRTNPSCLDNADRMWRGQDCVPAFTDQKTLTVLNTLVQKPNKPKLLMMYKPERESKMRLRGEKKSC